MNPALPNYYLHYEFSLIKDCMAKIKILIEVKKKGRAG